MATPGEESTDLSPGSKRPADTAFRQQRLPAWQPILTAKTVLPSFGLLGVIFVALGAILLMASNNVNEISKEYTNCLSQNNTGQKCSEVLANENKSQMFNVPCKCKIPVVLSQDFERNVFIYYSLNGFYQNHRRYVRSRDDDQLQGADPGGDLSSNCEPYRTDKNTDKNIAPCGAIANSMFNDKIVLKKEDDDSVVPVLNTGIAWKTDKEIKYKNPGGNEVKNNAALKKAFGDVVKPARWSKPIYELDLDNFENNGYKNEDFIVWMRTAALPHFRKLYRRVDHGVDGYKQGLPKGKYYLEIDYNYPVSDFDGQKFVVLTTTTWIGGKNPFLGISYLAVGSTCILLVFIFLAVHLKCGKKFVNIYDLDVSVDDDGRAGAVVTDYYLSISSQSHAAGTSRAAPTTRALEISTVTKH